MAAQGREAECTIYDVVLASKRSKRGTGHVKVPNQLNVGLSRSRDMFILACDTGALKKDKKFEKTVENMDTRIEIVIYISSYMGINIISPSIAGIIFKAKSLSGIYSIFAACLLEFPNQTNPKASAPFTFPRTSGSKFSKIAILKPGFTSLVGPCLSLNDRARVRPRRTVLPTKCTQNGPFTVISAPCHFYNKSFSYRST